MSATRVCGAHRLQTVQIVLAVVMAAAAVTPQASAQQSRQANASPVLAVSLKGLSSAIQTGYTWSVSNVADRSSVRVPAGSNKGFAQVRYTVNYRRTRQPQATYLITGSVVVADRSRFGHDIEQPTLRLTTGSGQRVDVPARAISCPTGLTVPPAGSLTCSFRLNYTGAQPLPGSITASVSAADTILPYTVASKPAKFDFANAAVTDVGSLATVSNYFEQGPGVLQPYGISGLQPPPGLTLEDSREFSYLALFGEIDVAKCGQQWKVINTAELLPSGPPAAAGQPAAAQPAATEQQVVIGLELVGCEMRGPGAPAAPVAAPPAVSAVSPAPALLPPASQAPPTAATPTPAASPRPGSAAPGVTVAPAGSTMCGGGACRPGQRCFDGWNCCAEDVTICGGVCCDGGRVCLQNQCVPQGSIPCGASVCVPGETCTNNVCCSATRAVCGTACCETGQTCVLGQCAATGSTACGSTICGPTQQCVSGVCCGAGETSCAGRCCGGGNICLQNQFCVPTGSSLCAGTVCGPTQQCASGMLCCAAGASVCGGTCCPNGQSCVSNRCVAPGSTPCGSNICTSAQSCQGGTVCCNSGETFCNNGCCAQGNTCINNQCVPSGSSACGATVVCPVNQFCGNTVTGLCCQAQQIACGNSCCPVQQVCVSQRCAPPGTIGGGIAGACGAGQFWCSAANRCCQLGWTCGLSGCQPGVQTLPAGVGIGRG